MTLGEESRRDDPRPSPELSCYTGTRHDGARGSGTRLKRNNIIVQNGFKESGIVKAFN